MSPRTPLVIAVISLGACVPTVPSAPPRTVDAGAEVAPPPGGDVGRGPAVALMDARAAETRWDAAIPDAAATPTDAGEAARDSGAPDAHDAGAPDASGARDTRDAASPRAPHPGEIAIQEIMVDPDGNDLGHEWIEIANVTAQALDLTALHVSDGTTDVTIDGGFLAAGRLLVLGQSADPAHNGGAAVDRAYGTRLALNNGADRVSMCLGPCGSGLVLDTFEWTAPLGAAYVGHAVVIVPGSRTTCPSMEPYGPAGDFGSPGQANAPCPPPDGG
jgi:hypothetical protein